jgi:hypothetical protein
MPRTAFICGRGTIVVGSVSDPTRASISGACVKLTHVATNAAIEVRTDDRGQYRTPPLRIGEYTIGIEAPGFKRFKWRFGRSGEFVSENASVAERFILDPSGDRFTYEATYADPTVLTRPFTITIPAKRVTDKTQVDDWNNETFLAKHEGSDPIIEDYERVCVEGNGTHGQVAADSK